MEIMENFKISKNKRWPTIFSASSLYLFIFIGILAIGGAIGYWFAPIDTTQSLLLSGALEIVVIGIPAIVMAIIYRKPKEILKINRAGVANIGLTIGMALTGYVVTVFVNLMWYLVLSQLGEPATQEIPVVKTGQEYLLAIVCICVLPAVCEEFMFRGILLSAFQQLGKWKAIALVGFLFGIYHVTLITIPAIVLLGMAIAWVVYQTQSIWCGILFHFIYNFISTSLTFVQSFFISELSGAELEMLEGGLGAMPAAQMLIAYIVWGFFAVGAATAFAGLGYVMKKINKDKYESHIPVSTEEIKPKVAFQLFPVYLTGAIILFLWVLEIIGMVAWG